MLVVQNLLNPSMIRHAVADAVDGNVVELRIASAYLTYDGSQIFLECFQRYFRPRDFDLIRKSVVTSFDFGLTDPKAIKLWQSLPNAEVRVAGAQMVRKGSLQPNAAYHPKMYIFMDAAGKATAIIGSANLTARGFTINTETAWVQPNITKSEINATWTAVIAGTDIVDEPLLNEYRALRKKFPPTSYEDVNPVPKPSPISSRLDVFREAISAGKLKPEEHAQMWVQVARLQGGSRNQLELPRGAHRFFGFKFAHYSGTNVEHIGEPYLMSGARNWHDRPLTWHGDNGMERLNLPTLSQGGFEYENSAILFRRIKPNVFELLVSPWHSNLANAWLQASIKTRDLFYLGTRTDRLVGFIR